MVASLAPGRRVSILSLKTRYSNNDHDDDDDNMARKKLLLYLLLFVMKQIAQLRSEQKTRHVAQLEILLSPPPPHRLCSVVFRLWLFNHSAGRWN